MFYQCNTALLLLDWTNDIVTMENKTAIFDSLERRNNTSSHNESRVADEV